RRRDRLSAARRNAGGDPLALRSGTHPGDLGHPGAGTPRQEGDPLPRRDDRRGDGGARRVRDAQQGTARRGGRRGAERCPDADAGAPAQEDAPAACAAAMVRHGVVAGATTEPSRRRPFLKPLTSHPYMICLTAGGHVALAKCRFTWMAAARRAGSVGVWGAPPAASAPPTTRAPTHAASREAHKPEAADARTAAGASRRAGRRPRTRWRRRGY